MSELEWRDPPPARSHVKGAWSDILTPLLKRPGQWAMIYEARSARQAQQRASNLTARLVSIPRPNDDWTFISRENEVFAIYRGKKRETRVRRAKSKR